MKRRWEIMSFTVKFESKNNLLCKVKKEKLNKGIPEDERDLFLVSCNPEPPHIRKYIDDLCSFFNVPSSVKNVLLLVLRNLDYSGCINLPTNYRALIC